MLLGIISDAHGNATALARCLDFMGRLDVRRVLHLGDAVGYLPHGARVVRMLADADAFCLQGNHEAMLAGVLPLSGHAEEIIGLRRFAADIDAAWLRRVERTGPLAELEIGGRRLVLAHGSPDDPLLGRVHGACDIAGLAHMDADAVLVGHTHVPMLERAGKTVLLNPGSCGLPRDQGDLPAFAVLDLETMQARVHRLRWPTTIDEPGVHPAVAACLARTCDAPFGEIQGEEA